MPLDLLQLYLSPKGCVAEEYSSVVLFVLNSWWDLIVWVHRVKSEQLKSQVE